MKINDFKEVVKKLIESICKSISSDTLLRFMNLFSHAGISKGKRKSHLAHNENEWKKYQEKYGFDYIEDQKKLGAMRYGNCFASYNACEVIAMWHAIKVLKSEGKLIDEAAGLKDMTFPVLLSQFEKKGISLGGQWGTSPNALLRFASENGLACRLLKDNELNRKVLGDIEKKHHVFILTTYNNKDSVFDMIHTMCITKDEKFQGKETFCLHNSQEAFKAYSTLYAAVTGYNNRKSKPICLIAI